jgi:hypothetical protein
VSLVQSWWQFKNSKLDNKWHWRFSQHTRSRCRSPDIWYCHGVCGSLLVRNVLPSSLTSSWIFTSSTFLRSLLFWDGMQQWFVVSYRHCTTTYQSYSDVIPQPENSGLKDYDAVSISVSWSFKRNGVPSYSRNPQTPMTKALCCLRSSGNTPYSLTSQKT